MHSKPLGVMQPVLQEASTSLLTLHTFPSSISRTIPYHDRLNRDTSPARHASTPDIASDRAHDGSRTPTLHTIKSIIGRVRRNNSTLSIQSGRDSAEVYVPPATPPFVISFVNTINNRKLSDFLLWSLYYDIVKPLECSSSWYQLNDSGDMRGWTALGQFLSTGINYGLDLVCLDSTIYRMRLEKQIVRDILVRISDPGAMAWTELTATLQTAEVEHMSQKEMPELVRCQLKKLLDILSCLKPTKDSLMAVWQTEIICRLRGFLDYLIISRLIYLHGMEFPLKTEGTYTAHGLGTSFDLMQQRRQVPLAPYETYSDSSSDGLSSSVPSLESEHPPHTIYQELSGRGWEGVVCESEKRRLNEENRLLRARVRNLNDEIRRTKQDKERLIEKIIQVGHDRIAEIPEPSSEPLILSTPMVTEISPGTHTRRDQPTPKEQPKDGLVYKYISRADTPPILTGSVTTTISTAFRPQRSSSPPRNGDTVVQQDISAPDGPDLEPPPSLPGSRQATPRSVDMRSSKSGRSPGAR